MDRPAAIHRTPFRFRHLMTPLMHCCFRGQYGVPSTSCQVDSRTLPGYRNWTETDSHPAGQPKSWCPSTADRFCSERRSLAGHAQYCFLHTTCRTTANTQHAVIAGFAGLHLLKVCRSVSFHETGAADPSFPIPVVSIFTAISYALT